MITISALLVVTTLLFAVDSSDTQLCNVPTVFQCVDDSGFNNGYLQCTPAGVDNTKKPDFCVAIPPLTPPAEIGCYGTGPIADICFVASCQLGPGNYPMLKAPKAYYTCAGSPIQYAGVSKCPLSYIFDVNEQDCVPEPTTTIAATAIATSPAPENSTTPVAPPTCSGQKLLPDLTSCNHFYVCAGATSGPGKRKQCPFKMRYDVENGKCKIRFLTKCGSRPESS